MYRNAAYWMVGASMAPLCDFGYLSRLAQQNLQDSWENMFFFAGSCMAQRSSLSGRSPFCQLVEMKKGSSAMMISTSSAFKQQYSWVYMRVSGPPYKGGEPQLLVLGYWTRPPSVGGSIPRHFKYKKQQDGAISVQVGLLK